MKTGRRYLRSRRAISGAVTALILVIVSVALALAVAVFAFGLFGTFGSSGQVQSIGTPTVNVITNITATKTSTVKVNTYNIIITVPLKNSGTTQASVQSITVGNITVAPGAVPKYESLVVSPTPIAGGFDGQLVITIGNVSYPSGVLSKANIGGSVPITITFSEGSLSPTLTLQGVLNNTTYPG